MRTDCKNRFFTDFQKKGGGYQYDCFFFPIKTWQMIAESFYPLPNITTKIYTGRWRAADSSMRQSQPFDHQPACVPTPLLVRSCGCLCPAVVCDRLKWITISFFGLLLYYFYIEICIDVFKFSFLFYIIIN